MAHGPQRTVARTAPSVHARDDRALPFRRAFPSREVTDLDPFLQLDHLGPVDLPPEGPADLPAHLHRGFQSMDWVLQGSLCHRDAAGNTLTLGPGDVLWCTAGAGLVYAGNPVRSQVPGRFHAVSLWVNLPRRDKSVAPRVQTVRAAAMPALQVTPGATVRALVGDSVPGAVPGTVTAAATVVCQHWTLAPGARVEAPLARALTGGVYVLAGTAAVGPTRTVVPAGTLCLLRQDGDSVALENPGSAPLDAMLLGGVPLREGVARFGALVMNTRAELVEAVNAHHRDQGDGRPGT